MKENKDELYDNPEIKVQGGTEPDLITSEDGVEMFDPNSYGQAWRRAIKETEVPWREKRLLKFSS